MNIPLILSQPNNSLPSFATKSSNKFYITSLSLYLVVKLFMLSIIFWLFVAYFYQIPSQPISTYLSSFERGT